MGKLLLQQLEHHGCDEKVLDHKLKPFLTELKSLHYTYGEFRKLCQRVTDELQYSEQCKQTHITGMYVDFNQP